MDVPLPVQVELPVIYKLGFENRRIQEDLAGNPIPQTRSQVVALLKQVIYYLTPCHLQFSIPFNPGTNRLCLETNCLAYCCFTLKTNPETLVMIWTEQSTFFAEVSTPTLIRNPVMASSWAVVLLCHNNSQSPANGNPTVIDAPMDCTEVKMGSVEMDETAVLTLTTLSTCLETHTLRHSE